MALSEYLRWVRGFLSARFEAAGPRAWSIRDYGTCRTVRFDGMDGVPDLRRSRNVAGFRRVGEALYVHLGPGGEALVALTPSVEAPRGQTYLIEANGEWRGNRIHSRTAAFARFMTPGGVVVRRADGHEVEVDLK